MRALVGLSGVTLVQGASFIPTGGFPILEVGKLIIQLLIGVVTIIQLKKKPLEVLSNQNPLIK